MDQFCVDFCGWHSYESSDDLKYAWIGVPYNGCPCFPQTDSSPNNNPAIDAVINVIAHEVAETATDADIHAWYYDDGTNFIENGDQCAWYFPDYQTDPDTGALYNIYVDSMYFYIQAIWNLQANDCTME